MIKTLKDFNFKGRKVLIRVDYNVPLDEKGDITDEFRIKATLPTLDYILKQMPKQIIIMTHVGRPKNKEKELRTDKIAARLGKLLNMPVRKVDGWEIDKGDDCKDCIVMLENLRFHAGEKSKDEKERDSFGKQLAKLGDIYVNDAFSNCHRNHASMTSVPKYLPGCIGFLVKNEIDMIKLTIEDPAKPFVSIIGGLKADKINAIQNLLKTADKILIGGALAFLFLKAAGHSVGKTKIDFEGLENAEGTIKELLENPKIILPLDCVAADKVEEGAKVKIVSVQDIPEEYMAVDIGPDTIKHYSIIIKQAKTVVWNGPMGVFEINKFANGTKMIAKAIVESKAKSIIGGGDSASAVEKFGYAKKMTHVSSGGGASLELFEGKELIALKALDK